MEFRGIINLSPHIAYQLSEYLLVKEAELSNNILDSIYIPEKTPELSRAQTESKLKFNDAISLFDKKIRLISLEDHHLKEEAFKSILLKINLGCWKYLEILENSITELFLQIKLLGIDRFNEETAEIIRSIKMTLMTHLEDFAWGLKRIEKQMGKLNQLSKDKTFYKLIGNVFSFFYPFIDKMILSNLQKSRKFLSFNYQKFHDEHVNYLKLKSDVRKKVLQLVDYPVLDSSLDPDSMEEFKKVYELLKCLELNKKLKLIQGDVLNESLSNLNDPKRMSHIFEEYQNALLKEVFEKSRFLKSDSEEILGNDEIKLALNFSLLTSLKEVHLLHSISANYRDFLLNTDKDPYVRARLGFQDEILGQESQLTKNLKELGYDIQKANDYFKILLKGVNEPFDNPNLAEIRKKSDAALHEMSQPLISESTMKNYAEKVLVELEHLNELGTLDFNVVEFVGKILLSLLKHDWKYHVLFSMPKFEQAYSIHIGILDKEHEDRLHLNRMNEFIRLGKEIKDLFKKKSLKSMDEIVLYLNDIKSSLQDFLGYVQHLSLDETNFSRVKKDIQFQLLEYRYFFGKYFYELEQIEQDKQQIRNQFLFIDQYLEVVDSLLN